ncbi:hypothetical protein QFZ54_001072 [Sphingomonas faeni]|nr:hypothetical protein [Sphingomonas faeni]
MAARFDMKGAGVGLEHLGDRALGHRIAVAALGQVTRYDVEQQHGDTGIGDLCRNARTHDARADDADLLDLIDHHARSSTVAMP